MCTVAMTVVRSCVSASLHTLLPVHCMVHLRCQQVRYVYRSCRINRNFVTSLHVCYIDAAVTGCCCNALAASPSLLSSASSSLLTTSASTSALSATSLLLSGLSAGSSFRSMATGLNTPKPLVVHWCWSSWDKLTRRQELIWQGWERSSLSRVLDKAQQQEAVKFVSAQKTEWRSLDRWKAMCRHKVTRICSE